MSIMTKRALQELDLGVAKVETLPPDPKAWAKFLEEQALRKEELIKELTNSVYPTTQIINGETTVKKYIEDVANSLANELLSRRISVKTLPLYAELAVLNQINFNF